MATLEAARLLGLAASGQQQLTAGLRLIATQEGGLTLVAGGPFVTVTVSAPPDYAGAYVVPVAAAVATPVPLAPPVIEGVAAVGSTLSARGALWVFGAGLSGTARRWRWQRDGVDIPAAQARDYTVAPADAGATLTVIETFDFTLGSAASTSAGVAV